MRKALGAMVGIFVLGGGAMTVLAGPLGARAEAAALGLVGVGLIGTGILLGRKPAPRAPELPTAPTSQRA
jgi:hypothetical protein